MTSSWSSEAEVLKLTDQRSPAKKLWDQCCTLGIDVVRARRKVIEEGGPQNAVALQKAQRCRQAAWGELKETFHVIHGGKAEEGPGEGQGKG